MKPYLTLCSQFGMAVLLFSLQACSNFARVNRSANVLDSYLSQGRVDCIVEIPSAPGGTPVLLATVRDINITLSRHGWIYIDAVPCQTAKCAAVINELRNNEEHLRFLIWRDRRCTPAQLKSVLEIINVQENESLYLVHYDQQGTLVASGIGGGVGGMGAAGSDLDNR